MKPVLVKAVVAESSIEGFNESILHRFAGLDVMEMNLGSLCPKVHGFASELRPIIRGDGFGQTTGAGKFLKDIDHGSAADGSIDMNGQALTGEVID